MFKTLRAAALAATLFSSVQLLHAQAAFTTPTNTQQPVSHAKHIEDILDTHGITIQESPFSYAHDIEIYNDLMGESLPMSPVIAAFAQEEHAYLDNAFFYKNIRILHDALKVRAHQLRKTPGSKTKVSLVAAKTDDGETIRGTFFDRGSDTLIVVGPGFTNTREKMAPFAEMFTEEDVLFFDLRGHGEEAVSLVKPKTWVSPVKHLFGIDNKKVTFGAKEDRDVHAIVSKMKARKHYNTVVGLGVCYSTVAFAKAASIYPRLFDKLILDGSWLTLQATVETLAKDPSKLVHPQIHSPLRNRWPFNQTWFQNTLITSGEWLLGMRLNETSMLDYLPKLDDRLEILFIHGKKDALIPNKHFEIIWGATKCPKRTAVITSCKHVRNHLSKKKKYAGLCKLFIHNSYRSFTKLLTNPSAYVTYKKNLLADKLAQAL